MKPVDVRFDVVIVGAGPAGSAAAHAAARAGARTLLLEKHPTVGIPLSCAEAISTSGLADILEEIQDRWVTAPIHTAVVVAPNGTRMRLHHPDAGYVLDRRAFDRDLALRAAGAGAEVWVESPAVAIEPEGDGFGAVLVDTPHGRLRVGARVIVAADGIESQVGRWAGLNTRLEVNALEATAQYLVAPVEVEPGVLEFHFGNDVAPGGYAWVIPKGPNSANVGAGVTPGLAAGCSARRWADAFLERRFGRRPAVLEYVVGGVPAFQGHRFMRIANVLLVGDAARLVDSLTGAGIANALLSGDLAGTAAARFVGSGSAQALQEYERQWRRRKGRQMRLYALAREIFLKVGEDDLNDVIAMLGRHFGDAPVTHVDAVATIKVIFRFRSSLLRLVRPVAW